MPNNLINVRVTLFGFSRWESYYKKVSVRRSSTFFLLGCNVVKKTTVIYLWPIVTFILIHFYKQYLVGEYQYQLVFNLVTDALLLLIIFAMSIERRSRVLKWVQLSIAILIISYDFIDTCVYLAIQNRLTFNMFVGNIEYFNVFFYFLKIQMFVLLIAVTVIPVILRKIKIAIPFSPFATTVFNVNILIVLVFASLMINRNSSIYNTADAINLSNNSIKATSVISETMNFLANNFASQKQRIQDHFDGNNLKNIPKDNSEKPNVIILLSESLSMVDSKYAGGLFDRLPNIDKVQKEGLAFRSAVANGKITPHGLAAFILSVQTTQTGGYAGMVDQFPPAKFSGNNIVSYAKNMGYDTIMMSPGQPISFYQMNDWFKQVGFDTIYNINSEIFASAPRFTWNAPSDQAMYDAALNMLPKLKKPYFMIIESVSLHQPYMLPDSNYKIGNKELLNLINYVDNTTFNFYEALKKQGFLNNGIFILFGDHRRFEPLEAAEINNGGYGKWHERIVCSITGKNVRPMSLYNAPFSLVDMNMLLHYMLNGQSIDNTTVLKASLSSQIGMDTPFNISLVDDDRGTYLIRSEKNAPLFISIFGKIPFDQIPNETYKNAVIYLIENYQQVINKTKDSVRSNLVRNFGF